VLRAIAEERRSRVERPRAITPDVIDLTAPHVIDLTAPHVIDLTAPVSVAS
jgi:hypothetical protein